MKEIAFNDYSALMVEYIKHKPGYIPMSFHAWLYDVIYSIPTLLDTLNIKPEKRDQTICNIAGEMVLMAEGSTDGWFKTQSKTLGKNFIFDGKETYYSSILL